MTQDLTALTDEQFEIYASMTDEQALMVKEKQAAITHETARRRKEDGGELRRELTTVLRNAAVNGDGVAVLRFDVTFANSPITYTYSATFLRGFWSMSGATQRGKSYSHVGLGQWLTKPDIKRLHVYRTLPVPHMKLKRTADGHLREG